MVLSLSWQASCARILARCAEVTEKDSIPSGGVNADLARRWATQLAGKVANVKVYYTGRADPLSW